MPLPPDPALAWAASGAMALTGWPDGRHVGPPEALLPVLAAAADRLGAVVEDPVALLGERAAHLGLTRAGTETCGGSGRLLPTLDGWIAVQLARPEDVELVPAWLGTPPLPAPQDPWPLVEGAVLERSTAALLAAADGLGLPLAALPDPRPTVGWAGGLPVRTTRCRTDRDPAASLAGLRVIDLTALWAGPLCGSLLAELGADVVKVESTDRPDGARSGPPGFFDLLNETKRSVALDLSSPSGRARLQALVEQADIVLEASRPRALAALGIHADRVLAEARPKVWVSITGYGRRGPGAHRVAFGDDAAVAGGLVGWDEGPVFLADAVADPITGLVAAAAVVEAVQRSGSWLVDAAMARVAAACAGPEVPVPAGTVAAPPRARPPTGVAPPLGAHTDAVLGALA